MKCKVSALMLMWLMCWASQSSAQPTRDKQKENLKYSLCKSTEHVVFTCKLKNKLASVCASENLNKTSGYIQYRFGDKQKIQLQVPSKKIEDRINVSYETQAAGASGIRDTLQFQSGNYYYQVYSSSYRSDKVSENGSSIWVSEDSVSARNQNRELFDRICTDYIFPIDESWLYGKIETKETSQ